jgi:DNA processing protein
MTETEAFVALNLLPRIGPMRVKKLLEKFPSPSAILGAGINQLQSVTGIGPETAAFLHQWEDHCDLTKELNEVKERGLTIVSQADEDYPKPLRNAYDPPLVLYVWGKLEERDQHSIAVVGSRRATMYGRNATKKLSFQLADAGFTIISGLARGIDTTAHEAALAANGRTIGIIGSGLAKLYPPENLALAEKIASGNGAIVSEFPLHTAPDKQTFPQRNRIVAAWCRALLVTECPAWSGALITANLATEYGKPVFAVPGQIDSPTSTGCNQLIRDGATLVGDASHILDDLNELPLLKNQMNLPQESAEEKIQLPTPSLKNDEQKIFSLLSHDEISVDRLIEQSGLPPNIVTSTLLKLEMKSLVRAFPGFRFSKR